MEEDTDIKEQGAKDGKRESRTSDRNRGGYGIS
jgi:hypothetical protein